MPKLILLEQRVEETPPDGPNLLRVQFPFSVPPLMTFDGNPPHLRQGHDIWITDTTFRDGQQARPPYTPEQIRDLFVLLSKLDNGTGTIRQSEFFLYSEKDRRAVELCREQGLEFPEITGWIRADPKDFALVKAMELKETGILTSISDYHIYWKMGSSREKIIGQYMGIVDAALEAGVLPRCHLEDLTKADFSKGGAVLEFVRALVKKSEESKVPIKIRLCDTMGYGVPYAEAALPRSVPKIVNALINEGVAPEQLEWHGHNDFHLVAANAMAAWLYGCSAANCTIAGFGERTGNPPLEGMVIALLQLTGAPIKPVNGNGLDTLVIKEIADYMRSTGLTISPNYPFIGRDCNSTSAGIHADALGKNVEIYTAFDTKGVLGVSPKITVNDKSGVAGIAEWINENVPFDVKGYRVGKGHLGVQKIYQVVTQQYKEGRTTAISPEEMAEMTRQYIPEAFVSGFEKIVQHAAQYGVQLLEDHVKQCIDGTGQKKWEQSIRELVEQTPIIQAAYVTDKDGKLTHLVADPKWAHMYTGIAIGTNLSDRNWYQNVMAGGKTHVTDLFTSKMTGALCITIATPITDQAGKITGIYEIDLNFGQLAKVINGHH